MSRGVGLVGAPVALVQRLNDGRLHLPPVGSSPAELIGASSAPLQATPQTAGVAHDKGAWVELIATTSVVMDGIRLFPTGNSSTATDTSCLLDIGIGAAASEFAVASQIDIGYFSTSGLEPTLIDVPVRIPLGSRVALRVQGGQTSTNKPVSAYGILVHPGQIRRAPAALVPIGSSTTTSQGTTLTAPGAANTKAAWTEIAATTTQALMGVLVCVGMSGTSQAASSSLVDVAVGASGAEVVISGNQPISTSASENCTGQRWKLVQAHIPAGSRLAARYQASATTAVVNVSFLGVPYS